MTYNCFSRIDPCTPAHKDRMIDSCHHHKFNPWNHNFDSRGCNSFDPNNHGLELNIQLPDFDINIPSCPACPPAPACPPCPQVKPEPKSEIIVDFSKLAITVNPITDDIIDVQTKDPTGYKFKECAKIIQNAKNNLEVIDGKLVGNCENNSECDKCVEVINSSIVDSQLSSTYNMSDFTYTI